MNDEDGGLRLEEAYNRPDEHPGHCALQIP